MHISYCPVLFFKRETHFTTLLFTGNFVLLNLLKQVRTWAPSSWPVLVTQLFNEVKKNKTKQKKPK